MNPYFSRLAQRSGVASTATNIRPGNASANVAPSWSEQSVETASVNALISNTESNTSASVIENISIHTSDHSLTSATTQSTNTPSKPEPLPRLSCCFGSLLQCRIDGFRGVKEHVPMIAEIVVVVRTAQIGNSPLRHAQPTLRFSKGSSIHD